jgi:flagellar assembly factor FliW
MIGGRTMELQTTRFGRLETIDIPEELVLEFPHGLPGFESQKSFALIEETDYLPFRWLQSLADPYVAFMVIAPELVIGSYDVDVNDLDVECLELDEGNDPDVLCILVMPEDVRSATVNLKAPIVVNRSRQRGKQVILTDERYPLRYRAFSPETRPRPVARPC